MSGSSERCLEAGWNTPRPRCTCSAGDDAPWSAHRMGFTKWGTISTPALDFVRADGFIGDINAFGASVRENPLTHHCFSSFMACDLYAWHKGCRYGSEKSFQCPGKMCGSIFTYCDFHGGARRAEAECAKHIETPHYTLADAAADLGRRLDEARARS